MDGAAVLAQTAAFSREEMHKRPAASDAALAIWTYATDAMKLGSEGAGSDV